MKIIIFSFNRALQLKALIDSILCFVGKDCSEIHVLYNSSNDAFQSGYDLLIGQYADKVSFHKERQQKYRYSCSELFDFYNLRLLYLCPFLRGGKTDFRDQLLSIIDNNDGEVMFLTDDSVFIHEVNISSVDLSWLHNDPMHRQISLRIGEEFKTADICYVDKNTWKFSSYSNRSIWGYGFSLDAHVYDAKAIKSFLRKATFKNPNTLESVGTLHAGKKRLFDEGRHLGNVKILSYPINIVQTTFNNEALHADVTTLNDYLLQGYDLKLPMPEKITDFQVYPDYVEVVKGVESVQLLIK